jgi:hypothetical protein
MLKKVEEWEKQEKNSSQSFVQNLKSKLGEAEQKLDKLVSAYIDADIPKEIYLKKKDELMSERAMLTSQLEDFGQKGKNWNEPLRSFILDTKRLLLNLSQKQSVKWKPPSRRRGGYRIKTRQRLAKVSICAP